MSRFIKLIRTNWLFLFLLVAGGVLRLAYSQIQLNPLINDNAKNGWEASHFFDDFQLADLLKILPNLEIFSWAVLFKIFGQNAFSYNLLGIFQFVVLAIFFYLTLQKIASQKTALFALSLLSFSPPIFALDNLFFPGHSRGVMFFWIFLYFFYLIAEKPTLKRYLFFGFLGGLGTVIGKFIPAIVLFLTLSLLILKKTLGQKKEAILFILIFIVSFFLFFNFPSLTELWVFEHFNPAFLEKFFRIIKISFAVSGASNTYGLQIGFQNSLPKFIYAFSFLIGGLLWFYFHRGEIKKVIIFPLYLILFFLIFAFTAPSEGVSRYYLSIIPIYIYFLADVLIEFSQMGNKLLKPFVLVFSFLFLVFSFFNNLHFYPSRYGPIFKIIEFAKDNNLRAVYTNYHLQFGLIFHSDGAITASSPLAPPMYKGSIFDEQVEKAPSICYLFEKENKAFEDQLEKNKITYQQKNFGELVFYYHFSRRFPPSEYYNIIK